MSTTIRYLAVLVSTLAARLSSSEEQLVIDSESGFYLHFKDAAQGVSLKLDRQRGSRPGLQAYTNRTLANELQYRKILTKPPNVDRTSCRIQCYDNLVFVPLKGQSKCPVFDDFRGNS